MGKTKLVPITNLDQLEAGSILTDNYGRNTCKILAKCGLIVVRSSFFDHTEASKFLTLESLKGGKYQLEVTEEPWVPEKRERCYIPWVNLDKANSKHYLWENSEFDRILLAKKLVCKTKKEALAKAQKMLDSIKDSE